MPIYLPVEGMESPVSAYHRLGSMLQPDRIIEISSWVLAMSASMILGLLSFSGMFTIWPILTLAFLAFLFAVVIEGEIYLQSIRSALEKLCDSKLHENQLLATYLIEKLIDYDKNKDTFLLQEPTDEDRRRVCVHNEVVIFKKDGGYKIGFRNTNEAYEERDLKDEQCDFLAHYEGKNAPSSQFMVLPGHHDRIQAILQEFNLGTSDREQKEYPLLVHAYRSQIRDLRQLNCYVHTQMENGAYQAELKNMGLHVTKLQNDMTEALFQDIKPAHNITPQYAFKMVHTGKKYKFDFKTMTVQTNEQPRKKTKSGVLKVVNQNISLPALLDLKLLEDNDPVLLELSKNAYEFHKNELLTWMRQDKEIWQKKLSRHTFNSRVALMLSAFSGLIMGIGTTYLIMEAVSVIPWLTVLPLGLFPPVIAPLALLAGVAYGLLIYNSSTDILLDNPVTKFIGRIRSLAAQKMSFKTGLILVLSVILFAVTLFLTFCTMGTWLTVFHKTKPLFSWLNWIPNIVLNLVIPTLIGASVLPFSIQSVASTLDSLEGNQNLDQAISAADPRSWMSASSQLPASLSEASEWLSERMWKKWVPNFLGISAKEFEAETPMQRLNPYRILYRLFFEPLRQFVFIGHLASAGVTGDQIESVSIYWSFWVNFWFEFFEDWDWIMGRDHVDNIDTVDLIRERAQNSDDHNHDNNFPMRLLKSIFAPIIWRAAQWADDHRNKEDEPASTVELRYQRLLGFKPELAAPKIPEYRKKDNFNLFLFKSAMYEVPARDDCVSCSKLRM